MDPIYGSIEYKEDGPIDGIHQRITSMDKGRFVEGGEGDGRFLDQAERERGFVNGQEEIEFGHDAGS